MDIAPFIGQTLRTVMDDFTATVPTVGKLCPCKGLTYESGLSPDYSNPLVEQIYMLRYFPAYFVEYIVMYTRLLESGFLPGKIKVMSIGCGSGIDLWALHFVMDEAHRDATKELDYTGVDILKWRFLHVDYLQTAKFICTDISQWDQLDRPDYNVFVFPKCIGELPQPVFEKVCTIFQNTQFTEHKVCGLCSVMKIRDDIDVQRFARIAEIMQTQHGFECLDEKQQFWYFPQDHGLRKHCSSFIYPEDIKVRVAHLLKECPTNIKNGKPCKEDCESRLNKSPILTTTYLKYQLLRFQRRTAKSPTST